MQLVSSQIKKKLSTTFKTAALLAVTYSVSALAQPKVDINALAGQCIACHGQQGVSSNDQWPNLAGQKQAYLIKEISAFRGGARQNTLMTPMVKDLSDTEIRALASYFSSQVNTTKPAASENIAGKHVRARCVSCHGMKGFTVNSLWPNLAGQKSKYLQNQLQAFKSGERKSPIMEVIAKELNEQQIADVAEYYSQQLAKLE